MPYQNTATRARVSPDPSITRRRASFAREAKIDAFRSRDLSLAREPGFVDHQPGRAPQRLDQIATEITEDLGQAALRHWLVQAAEAGSLEQRQAALEIAQEIARLAGIPFEEPVEEAAA